MACDTQLRENQTITERKEEVLRAVEIFNKALASGRVRPKVGPQGAIAFDGITDAERNGVTDACVYRRLMVTGSSLAKAAIQRAEQMAGRTVDRRVVGVGAHSHDGGRTWHDHKG